MFWKFSHILGCTAYVKLVIIESFTFRLLGFLDLPKGFTAEQNSSFMPRYVVKIPYERESVAYLSARGVKNGLIASKLTEAIYVVVRNNFLIG